MEWEAQHCANGCCKEMAFFDARFGVAKSFPIIVSGREHSASSDERMHFAVCISPCAQSAILASHLRQPCFPLPFLDTSSSQCPLMEFYGVGSRLLYPM